MTISEALAVQGTVLTLASIVCLIVVGVMAESWDRTPVVPLALRVAVWALPILAAASFIAAGWMGVTK